MNVDLEITYYRGVTAVLYREESDDKYRSLSLWVLNARSMPTSITMKNRL